MKDYAYSDTLLQGSFLPREGLLVNTWVVDTVEDVLKSIETRVDFIATDTPRLMLKTIHGRVL